MNSDNPIAGTIDRAVSDRNVIETEVLIVGFGFSVIPLLRELEREGIDYVAISSGQSIWDKLEKHGRLDFDMVSSMHTSLYSFELVKRDRKDRYLPVREFQAFIKQYLAEYGSRVVNDWVTIVENHDSHSIVRTRGGRVFKAKHLICATAFKRRMNQQLNEFDYASAKNKTIAITAMGDSVNLMISKLIPYNNRIVLVTNGAFMLDKMSIYDGTSYTLDQLEYHNVRHLANMLYRKTFFAGTEWVVTCQKIGFPPIEHTYFRYPAIRRRIDNRYLLCPSPVPNGSIVIKYWPIDAFQQLFDKGSLKQSIKDGYLLNDLPYFLQQGLIELWPKSETTIDSEQRKIRWKDNVVEYDFLIDGDYEVPNLPEIVIHREDGKPDRTYEYVCRDCYLGIVPKDLRNIYLIGYTRPMTGGLNTIIEMQCLFTHKMITDPDFHDEIYRDIDQRIRKYDRHYRISKEPTPIDHLVAYGFYADDVATAMKINSSVWRCRSLKDLAMHFLFPNTPFKFRQDGPYKVDGVKEMVDKIYEDHKGYSIVLQSLLTYVLLQATAYLGLTLTWYQQPFYFPTWAFVVSLLIVWLNPISSFVAASGYGRNSYVNVVMLAALALTAVYPSPWIPLGSLLVASALTYFFRQMGWSRLPFNDLKNKKSPEFRQFFERYCEAFREVFTKRESDGADGLLRNQNEPPAPRRAAQ